MRALWLAMGFAAALAACSIDAVTFTLATEDCAVSGDEDGNGLADCGDPACEAACQVVCGNGTPEAGEMCDDGNRSNGDGCDNNCTMSGCGNGAQSSTEMCDDGDPDSGDGCDSNCTVTACGNDVLTTVTGEVCDDGNLTDGDDCDSNCTVTACGNDVLTTVTGEVCDDGNLTDGDNCDSNCTVTACGNDVLTTATGEVCDDGNLIDGDNCDSNCTPTACLNGIPTGTEQCDDGNMVNGDGCDNNCTDTACLNGIETTGEQCDDGNMVNGDGCDNNCTDTACLNGIETTGEQCDDGNMVNGDGCDNNCTDTACLNGIETGIEECDDGNMVNGDGCDNNCTDTGCGNGITTTGEQCDDGNLVDGDGCQSNCTISIGLQAYIKQSNTGASDQFGSSIAISADGSTLAVSATGEDSAVLGINGDQSNNGAASAGAVYVFVRSGPSWIQQAYIKASNTNTNDQFGNTLALSADGSTLAVGARLEASAATGIGGNQADNSVANAGAVYVFTRSGATWSQQAYVKASNTAASDLFGASVSLSGDGSTLAVGAFGEDSSATGVNGIQTDNSATDSGAVYVFTRSGTTWSQQAYIKASNTGTSDQFGSSVALAGDGSTLAVGALGEDSNAVGIDGDPLNNALSSAGAVYVFTRSGTTWSQQAYVKASNTGATDQFGQSLALSGNGGTLAVGAKEEDSNATGIDGNQDDNSSGSSGAVYVFVRSGVTWSQQAYVKASNTGPTDVFGQSLAMSSDGATLAVGANLEDSAATGVNGIQSDNTAGNSGAIYTFRRSGTTWTQSLYVKASNTGVSDQFGVGVALSGDGLTLAASGFAEDSGAVGVGGNQNDNSVTDSGAVYVYR